MPKQQTEQWYRLLVDHFGLMVKGIGEADGEGRSKVARLATYGDAVAQANKIKEIEWDLVIIDETHRFRIGNLKAQQIKIEIERDETPTIEKIFEFVAETINGDINDKQFQEQVINRLINCVYVADDKTLIYFSFDNENTFIFLSDTSEVIAEAKKKEVLETSSNTSDAGGEGGI